MDFALARRSRAKLIIRSAAIAAPILPLSTTVIEPAYAADVTINDFSQPILLPKTTSPYTIIINAPQGTTATEPDGTTILNITLSPAGGTRSTTSFMIPSKPPWTVYVDAPATDTVSHSDVGSTPMSFASTNVSIAPPPDQAASGNCSTSTASFLSCSGFGAAIGYFLLPKPGDITSPPTTDTVTIGGNAQKIVRVSNVTKHEISIWLEAHALWGPYPVCLWAAGCKNVAIGPFGALQASSDTVFKSIAGGLMIGFPDDHIGVGIGQGFTQVTHLTSGIVANQPLPATFTDVETVKTDAIGWVVMISYQFKL
ncbi:MAG TPA: hypothetical protein VFW28_08175 [Micropepsaceae bacterium]|nr:hypothetical protein [Micropepsaceae bacterium]